MNAKGETQRKLHAAIVIDSPTTVTHLPPMFLFGPIEGIVEKNNRLLCRIRSYHLMSSNRL